MTTTGTIIYMPEEMQPKLFIPRHIAEQFMIYGMIGYRDHQSEWGCAVKLSRDGEYGAVTVEDYKLYDIEASGGYWEAAEDQQGKHAAELIADGKADDLQYWNGLFHTHPIGSTASMSGTDKTQLEDLAGENYWGLSIICPANKEAAVDPSKWLYHYADARPFSSTVVVTNLKPTIEAPAAVVDPYAADAEVMKGIMRKKVYTRGWQGNGKQSTIGFNPKELEDSQSRIDQMVLDAKATSEEADLFLAQIESPPLIVDGDWVFIEKVCRDTGVMLNLKDDKENFLALEGTVCKVNGYGSGGSVTVNAPCGTKFFISPQENDYDMDPYVDMVYRIAAKGSTAARLLENQMQRLKYVTPTEKMFRDAGLPCPDKWMKKKSIPTIKKKAGSKK